MDPATADACLHLSAVVLKPYSNPPTPAVPVACGAALIPTSGFKPLRGHALASTGNMQWHSCQGCQTFTVLGLVSKQLTGGRALVDGKVQDIKVISHHRLSISIFETCKDVTKGNISEIYCLS